MKQFARLMLVLLLLVVLLPARDAAAQAPAQVGVDCATVAAQLKASYSEGMLPEGEVRGAKYCVIIPRGNRWNRDLVVFAHGYVFADPLNPLKQPEIPWDQAIRGDLNLPGILVNLGYGFAITSYRKDGLAIKEGVQDIVALVKHIKATNSRVRRIFLTGASEGGEVTTLALERYPALFAGGLSTCGPIGDFRRQVNYWGDFRVLFDQVFPAALRFPFEAGLRYPDSTPVVIAPEVMLGWGTETAPGLVAQAVGYMVSQAQAPVLDQLLAASKAPYDADVPDTKLATIAGILTYNVMATNEAKVELTGNPYGNSGIVNGIPVEAITADQSALNEIATNYQTSGKLSRQLVVMHTTGDPIVPFWHTTLYLKKAIKAGSLGKLTLIPVSRYGHCNFTPAEAVFGFYVMVLRSTLQPFTAEQLKRALPEAAAQKEFRALKEKGPAK
jgi:pimeloyl-ACP methyl ester carboxylesterase